MPWRPTQRRRACSRGKPGRRSATGSSARRIGPDVPMVATLDLHANATLRMAGNANALVSFRTYPHIDGYDRAVQAAALVQEVLEGKKTPRCLLSQPAMLEGADHGRTTQPGVMRDL